MSSTLLELDISNNQRHSDYADNALADLGALKILNLDCLSGMKAFSFSHYINADLAC